MKRMELKSGAVYESPEMACMETVAEKGFAFSGEEAMEESMGVDAPHYIQGFDF